MQAKKGGWPPLPRWPHTGKWMANRARIAASVAASNRAVARCDRIASLRARLIDQVGLATRLPFLGRGPVGKRRLDIVALDSRQGLIAAQAMRRPPLHCT